MNVLHLSDEVAQGIDLAPLSVDFDDVQAVLSLDGDLVDLASGPCADLHDRHPCRPAHFHADRDVVGPVSAARAEACSIRRK